MITDLELMNLHIRALFTYNATSQMLYVNEPDSAVIPAPRFLLGRTREGNVWRVPPGRPAPPVPQRI